jgi:hypothetical protein
MSRKPAAAEPARLLAEDNFSFELLKPYPEARAFMIKKPLKGSVTDAIFELLGSKR